MLIVDSFCARFRSLDVLLYHVAAVGIITKLRLKC